MFKNPFSGKKPQEVKKDILIEKHETVKKFSVSKGKMSFNFGVDIEIKQDLKDSLELLEKLVVLIKEELEKHQ